MNQTPNVQPCSAKPATQGEEERPTMNAEVSGDGTSNIKQRRSNILWRIFDFIVAAIFIYAGVLKVLDPIQLAHDINNYRILPLCGLGLAFRFLYRGALSILTVLIVVFTLATIAAKARGLDITCGCFGHASQHWSFPAHLATNVGILAALLMLWFQGNARVKAAD